MRVALLQTNPAAGSLSANAEALLVAARAAGGIGAELCVAPELALCGHNAGDLLLYKSFIADCRQTLQDMAGALAADGVPLLLGAPVANPVPQGKRLQNCAVLLHEGKVTVIGRKVLLPSEGLLDDPRYFEPGVACGVLHFKGWRLLVTVGEDVWSNRSFWKERRTYDTDPVAEFMAAGGADGLINLTALPYAQGLPGLHQRMMAWTASQYRVPVVVANLAGGNDSQVYFGGSLAFDGEGNLCGRAPLFRESILLADLAGRRAGIIAPDLSVEEELWQAVVTGTRDFARKCGFNRAVIGLSGGVDSALVAAVAAEALGAGQVTGLLMPSPHSSAGSVDDSLALAEALGIATHRLPIEGPMEAFGRIFADAFPGGLHGVALENVQSRIRGTLLMTFANSFGGLVLNTGNKSEVAVGYATLYGDMTGGIGPIGDLYKHQVYSLCRWYNHANGERIPAPILEKAPSAELRPGQKDSDFLPPYDILDPLLFAIIEKGQGREALEADGFEPETVRRVLALVRKAEFKRHQAPPSLQLTGRGFGGGWRMPIARGENGKAHS